MDNKQQEEKDLASMVEALLREVEELKKLIERELKKIRKKDNRTAL